MASSTIINPYKLQPLSQNCPKPIENPTGNIKSIGVISPPEKIAKASFISSAEASRQFNKINRELEGEINKHKGKKSPKSPTSIKILKTLLIGTALFFAGKKFGPKILEKIKNVFKKP